MKSSSNDNILTIAKGHIMPSEGSYSNAIGTLGRSGLRQLKNALLDYFGADVLNIPQTLGRTTGARKAFGPMKLGR